MGNVLYITGGARSGKSSFAEAKAAALARQAERRVCYLATAQAFDAEMTERIGRHRADRPAEWQTLEEPLALVQTLKELAKTAPLDILLIDCLSLWVSNMLLADYTPDQMLEQTHKLLAVLVQREAASLLVSNEVGMGIVPDNALARQYRDALGWVNQACASASHEAYLLVSGLPLQLK